jgi:hypothetical protein
MEKSNDCPSSEREGARANLGRLVVLGAAAGQITRGRSLPEGDEGNHMSKREELIFSAGVAVGAVMIAVIVIIKPLFQ